MKKSVSRAVISYEWLDSSKLEIVSELVTLRLTFLEPSVVRCRYVSGIIFDAVPSYGVDPQYRQIYMNLTDEETDDYIEVTTPDLRVRIRRVDMGLEFYDRESGLLLSADAEGMGHRKDDNTGDHAFWVNKHMGDQAHFYGLGDKPCQLNLRGRRFELWGADHYDFKSDSDPLYKNIPFFISLDKGNCYGIFFDNTMRPYFDFGKTRDDRLLFGADGGLMDYYFIGGSTGVDVVANYTKLTGLPPMPPLWSLGYHQSKWSYYPQDVVEKLADKFRKHKIPCDAIHLDIHHMDAYQVLTWDKNNFPDPKGMICKLEKQGIKAVSIVNPGIKINPDNYIWRSGFESNVFCRRHDGALFTGRVWPGHCNFPDFTSPRVREWWKGLFVHNIADKGIRGLWVDMNEPVVFPNKTFPDDTRHDFDGYSCSHRKAHNVYGQCMVMATRDAMLMHAPKRRPFMMTRSGYAGLQRYAATWTGDNSSNWVNLKMANIMIQRLSSSGVSFCGSDTGGFLGLPSPELFCRWMQLSAFHILMRTHSNGEFSERDPMSYGKGVEHICRHAIEERYRLLPYLYTQFYLYSTKGTPIIRSLALQYSTNDDTYWRSSEFFLGEALYVVPVHHEKEKWRKCYLPEGSWYCFWTDKCYTHNKAEECVVATPIEHIPVLVKGGCVIPRWPVQQYVGEIATPHVTYDLWWAANSDQMSLHYEDEGDGYAYEKGRYLRHQFHYTADEQSLSLHHQWMGDLELPGDPEVTFNLRGLAAHKDIVLNINSSDDIHMRSDEDGKLSLELPRFFKQIQIRLLS